MYQDKTSRDKTSHPLQNVLSLKTSQIHNAPSPKMSRTSKHLSCKTFQLRKVPAQNVPTTKHPRFKTSRAPNIPSLKTSQDSKGPKPQNIQNTERPNVLDWIKLYAPNYETTFISCKRNTIHQTWRFSFLYISYVPETWLSKQHVASGNPLSVALKNNYSSSLPKKKQYVASGKPVCFTQNNDSSHREGYSIV
jgi:hypothetical protein